MSMTPNTMTDVAVVGGSFAGLSAALQLARARRSVMVLDTGKPRNRFAKASHGFLSQDGIAPADILAKARAQLSAYPTVEFRNIAAENAEGSVDAFTLTLSDGGELSARRIILAHGVSDSLPEIPGLAAEWGKRVAHCPYCHGYEFAGGPLGVLAANGALALHHALLVREWGPMTLFLNGKVEPDEDMLKKFAARGVTVEARLVEEVVSREDHLTVTLAGGHAIDLAGLFTQPTSTLTSSIGEQLGCLHVDGQFGQILKVDDMKQTTVPGVFAAGDIARPAPNVPLAVADGTMAGVAAHKSLVFG
jgi:thioredoxin reductase